MEEQEKKASTVRSVVILVGCAFAALFVAMVVVMAVRGMPKLAGESTDRIVYTMSPAASAVAFVPGPGPSESGRVRYEKVFREAPVFTSYWLEVTPAGSSYTFEGAPHGASYRFHGTPFSSSYTFEGARYGAGFEFSSPVAYYHMSTGEKTVTGADPKEKKK